MILVGGGAWVIGRSIRLFHFGSGLGLAAVGGVQAVLGGPRVASNSWVQAGSQGQPVGR